MLDSAGRWDIEVPPAAILNTGSQVRVEGQLVIRPVGVKDHHLSNEEVELYLSVPDNIDLSQMIFNGTLTSAIGRATDAEEELAGVIFQATNARLMTNVEENLLRLTTRVTASDNWVLQLNYQYTFVGHL